MHAKKCVGFFLPRWIGTISVRLLIVAVIAFVVAPVALAEPPPEPVSERNWTFAVAPYIWLPAMTGSAEVDGRKVDIDTTVGDLFTESDFIFAIQADFEAWYKHRFGLIFNGQWATLEQDDNKLGPEDGPPFGFPGGPGGPGIFPIEFDLKSNIGIFEFLGAFQLGSWEWGQGPFSTTFTFEPLAGIRVTYMKVTLDPKGDFSKIKESKTWVDPILGARMTFAFGAERRGYSERGATTVASAPVRSSPGTWRGCSATNGASRPSISRRPSACAPSHKTT
jgi:hypothetical protein